MENPAFRKMTRILWVLTFIYFGITGVFILMFALWSFSPVIMVLSFVIPVFYLVTLIRKKQYECSAVIYVISIIGIIGSVLFLAVFASGGARASIFLATPVAGVVILAVFSLVFNIKLMGSAKVISKERSYFMMMQTSPPAAYSAYASQSQDTTFPQVANTEAPQYQIPPLSALPEEKTNKTGLIVLGIISIIVSFSSFLFGLPGVVCGIIGIVLSYRVRHKHKVMIGMILNIIGLGFGAFLLFVFSITMIITGQLF